MSRQIKTAVFPVAGRGTRFLPATKAAPKEMLPIVDKPLIQYAVEEALSAGATRLVFVTSKTKRAIEDHFAYDPELEAELKATGKTGILEAIQNIIPDGVTCHYVLQPEPLGLGHAVLCAQDTVGNEPFYVHLADDLIAADPTVLRQMKAVFDDTGNSVIAVEPVPPDQTGRYGIVATDPRAAKRSVIRDIVEKPAPDEAPSNLAVVGRYILVPAIFDYLAATGRGAGGEIQLTDALAAQLEHDPILAYQFEGIRYDCGSKLGYLRATVEFGLRHPALGSRFQDYLDDLVTRKNG